MARREVYQLEDNFFVAPELCRTWGRNDGLNNSINDVDVTTPIWRWGEGKSGVRISSFVRFHMPTLPANSIIRNAKISTVAATNELTSARFIDVACLQPDGRWEKTPNRVSLAGGTQRWVVDGDAEYKIPTKILQTLTVLGVAGTFAAGDSFRVLTNHLDSISGSNQPYEISYAQVVKIDTNGTSNGTNIRMGKIGSPSGTYVARLWSVDGNFKPVSVVTNSPPKDASSIPAGPGGVGFTWSNFSVTAGEYYAVEILKFTGPRDDENSHLYLTCNTDETADAEEILWSSGTPAAFGRASYPTKGPHLPFLYAGNSGTTFDYPPHGSVVSPQLPLFSIGDTVEITGLETIVQEWINSPLYEQYGRIIGFVIDPADHYDASSAVNWTDPITLEVEFDPSSEVFIT